MNWRPSPAVPPSPCEPVKQRVEDAAGSGSGHRRREKHLARAIGDRFVERVPARATSMRSATLKAPRILSLGRQTVRRWRHRSSAQIVAVLACSHTRRTSRLRDRRSDRARGNARSRISCCSPPWRQFTLRPAGYDDIAPINLADQSPRSPHPTSPPVGAEVRPATEHHHLVAVAVKHGQESSPRPDPRNRSSQDHGRGKACCINGMFTDNLANQAT